MNSPGGYEPQRHQQNQSSTTQVAKEEANNLARTAADSGGQVGQTAGEQAKRVADETRRQARDLAREGRQQLADQARQGQQKAAGGLRTLADQLQEMSEKSDGSGLAPEVVRQASERTRGLASWLDEREPGALLDEVRAFARRKPGLFLAGATIAGVLVGRLTRGAVEAARDDHDSGDGEASVAPRGAVAGQPAQPPAGQPAQAPYPVDPGSAYLPPQAAPPVPGYSAPPSPTPTPIPEPEPWRGTADPRSGPVTR